MYRHGMGSRVRVKILLPRTRMQDVYVSWLLLCEGVGKDECCSSSNGRPSTLVIFLHFSQTRCAVLSHTCDVTATVNTSCGGVIFRKNEDALQIEKIYRRVGGLSRSNRIYGKLFNEDIARGLLSEDCPREQRPNLVEVLGTYRGTVLKSWSPSKRHKM